MMAQAASVWKIAGVVSAVKLLLIPSYRSTDFEVHRNWLAITHSLPPRKWYSETTSEWTLDYPPLFAWFEYLLSQLALYVDPKMLVVSNLKYISIATILFQRGSVICTDFVYVYAVNEYCKNCLPKGDIPGQFIHRATTLSVLLLANFGLILVDHIHFQYNGFLFGLMLLSISKMCQHKHLESAFWFAVLLNFKHIYLYVAPAYFVYLLRNYCFQRNHKDGAIMWTSFSPLRFLTLAVIVGSVFVLSFGPFVAMGQLAQVVSRLFPFKRGLCHAYWAPNFWALYNMADKVVSVAATRLGVQGPANSSSGAAMTGGLVQEFEHATLPQVRPVVTMVVTLLAIMPSLVHLWQRPTGPKGFIRCVVLCAFGSFLFGWHVHEKAILLLIIPLTLLAVENKKDAEVFLMLTTSGHFALFPLIFTPAEMPIKYCLMIVYTILAFHLIGNTFHCPRTWLGVPLLRLPDILFLLGLIPLELYCVVGHRALGLQARLPFVPLLLTSVYTALGVLSSWLHFYAATICGGGPSPGVPAASRRRAAKAE